MSDGALSIRWLGRMAFGDALALQEKMVAERRANHSLGDQFLLLEHEPVYTIGRTLDQSSLRDVTDLPHPLFPINRGGQATYHGPGQLIGYPIIEAYSDGTFVVTKHQGTGGRITVASVKEQLLYEMGDPHEYITPDCVADFATIQLEQDGTNRVRFSGIKGKPATDLFKVSVSFSAGWKAIGSLVYAWPDAYRKARLADRVLRERLDRLGLKFDKTLTEFVGVDACHGQLSGPPSNDIAEVTFRIGVRSEDKRAVEQFTREIAPLVLNGPPTVTGFAGGRPKVEEIIAYWPALVPKGEVSPEISVIEA